MDSSQDVPLPSELQGLSNLLEEFPETLASGNQDIQAAALNATKYAFDLSIQSEESSKSHVVELMTSLLGSQAAQTRSRAKKEAEKSSPQFTDRNLFDSTPLTSLYVDGMEEEQIWEQLDLRTKTICRVLHFILEGKSETEQGRDLENEDEDEMRLLKALEDLQGEDIDMDDLMGEESESSSGQSASRSGSSSSSGSELDGEENYSSLRDPSEDEDGEVEPPVLNSPNQSHSRKKRGRNAGVSELDDDFFNLAEFNADTERAEARSFSRGQPAEKDDESDEDTDVDLFARVDPVENFDEEDLEGNADVLFYKDFFQPPSPSSAPAKIKSKTLTYHTSQVRFHDQVRVKKIKPTGKNKSLHNNDDEDDSLLEEDDVTGGVEDEMEWSDEDEEMEDDEDEEDGDEDEDEEEEDDDDDNEENPKLGEKQTIERLKHDLFAEEEEEIQDDLTMHERRMATLRDQIAELESENVAKKDWVLMGEAGSRQRPQNSLLEEDLEFDRVIKAVPVMTEEAVQSLEEIIKARILEGRFDDVIRLRPLDDKPFLPSKLFELQDSKSTQSLAQIYENEYSSAQSGVSTDDRDGKLKKEHGEISQVWDKICGKLDALCNAHFVPKQPKATISTMSNVATATLESALPTSKSTATMLSPEETYATSSSLQRARSELTPVEKRGLRTRERKARQRHRKALDQSVDKYAKATSLGSVKRQKEAALKSVVKHGKGVTVVGKKIAKDKKTKV